MKHFPINHRILFATAGTFALVGGLGVFKAQADSWDKKTILTINEPMQVRERLLAPGTYVFKLLDSTSERHVVQIFNRDQSKIVDTVLAIPNYRLEPTGDSRFRFWETPPGKAKALRAWFYPGDNFGQEFPYPKRLASIETASLSMSTTPVPAQQQSMEQPAQSSAPATTDSGYLNTQKPVEPREVAANTPPPTAAAEAPAPTAAEPEPAPAPQAQPAADPAPAQQTLPKTASLNSLVGLVGIACLGLFGIVREKGKRVRS